MQSSSKQSFELALDRAIRRYYSHRPKDVEEARRVVVEAIQAGAISPERDPIDLVNECLLGNRDHEYLTVRNLALQILRDPLRIGTMSTGERLAMALLFERPEWLREDSYAWAAQRVRVGWVCAIVNVENDFRWLEPPIVTRGMRPV